MDEATRQRWLQVKAALEAAGKTDCHYYRMALAALQSQLNGQRPIADT